MLCHTLLKLSLLVVVLACGTYAASSWSSRCPLQTAVACSSWGYRYKACRVPGAPWLIPTGRLSIIKQNSKTRCLFRRNYGIRGNYVWVNKGCRAVFRVCRKRSNPCRRIKYVTCQSWRYRYQRCRALRTSYVKKMYLVKRYSRSPCILRRTYGYFRRSTYIWVNKGCRGRFKVCY